MSTKMKIVEMANYGSADVLKEKQQAIPKAKPGELVVRTEAIGVNFSDILRRQNQYFMPTPLPYVLGSEVVGQVFERGPGLAETDFPMGSRVLAILPSGGGYAEYAVSPAQYCVPLPPHVSSIDASVLFVQGSTAHLMLNRVAGSLEGKTVLVHAAGGGVGSLLVQLAKMMGAEVIAAASSDEKLQFAQELGADEVINYSRPNWTEELLEKREEKKADYIFEMVGGKIYSQSFACLKPGGSMIVYGSASRERGLMHSEHFVDENHNLLSFNLAHYIQHHIEWWQASLGAMIGILAEGKIKVHSQTYPLAEVGQAHRDIEARITQGKVVLIP